MINDEEYKKYGFSSKEDMDFYVENILPLEFEMYRNHMESNVKMPVYRKKKLKKPNLNEFKINCMEENPPSSCKCKTICSADPQIEKVENPVKAKDSENSKTTSSKNEDFSVDIMRKFGEILVGKKHEKPSSSKKVETQNSATSETPEKKTLEEKKKKKEKKVPLENQKPGDSDKKDEQKTKVLETPVKHQNLAKKDKQKTKVSETPVKSQDSTKKDEQKTKVSETPVKSQDSAKKDEQKTKVSETPVKSQDSTKKDEQKVKVSETPVKSQDSTKKDEQKAKVSENPVERFVLVPEMDEEEMKSLSKKQLKKLKKLRQKEKKVLEKQKNEPQTQTQQSEKKKKEKIVEEMKTEEEILESNCSSDEETAENVTEDWEGTIDFGNNTPAFFQMVLKNTAKKLDEKKKISEGKGGRSGTESRRKIEPLMENIDENNIVETDVASNDFTTFTKKFKGKRLKTSEKLPEDHASDAIEYIYANKVEAAVESLTLAISLDPNNNDFYLNRSYCFLRLRQYQSALSDAERIFKNGQNIKELIQAKARAGQACFGMQNYEKAEKCFEDCLGLAPDNFHVQRELMRLRIEQLMNMGFSERAAIFALEKHSNIPDAVQYLTENQVIEESENSSESDFDCIDEMVFCSDSEDCPSNTRLISKILNYKPQSVDKRLMKSEINIQKSSKIGTKRFEKKIAATSGTKYMTKAPYYPTTVWVGNLGPKITEKMLRKTFSKYGHIEFIGHRSGDTYAFINFHKAESVIKILAVANMFEINGVKLRVAQAHASS